LRLVSGGNRIQSIVWKGISANQVRPEYPQLGVTVSAAFHGGGTNSKGGKLNYLK